MIGVWRTGFCHRQQIIAYPRAHASNLYDAVRTPKRPRACCRIPAAVTDSRNSSTSRTGSKILVVTTYTSADRPDLHPLRDLKPLRPAVQIGGSRSFRRPRPVVIWAEFLAGRQLSRCPGYVGGDDVSGVPVQAGPRPVVAHRGAPLGCSDERMPQRVGADVLAIPARRVTRRTTRAGAVRVQPRPSPARKSGPSVRSPIARSIARAVRGASGIVTTLPPLRVMTRSGGRAPVRGARYPRRSPRTRAGR